MALAETPATVPPHLRPVSVGVLLLRETTTFTNPAALPALTVPKNPAYPRADFLAAAAATPSTLKLYRFEQDPLGNPAKSTGGWRWRSSRSIRPKAKSP